MKFIKISIVFTLFIITYYSLQIPDKLSIPTNDKVGHFLAYSILSIQCFLLCNTMNKKIKTTIMIASYGILMEFIQSFVPEREPSFFDIIANTSGILFSLITVFLFQQQIHSILKKININLH